MRLSSLLEVTKAINSNFSRDQLLKIYESILKNQLKVEQFAVYSAVNYSRIHLELSSGIPAESLQLFEVESFLSKITASHEIYALSDDLIHFFDTIIPVFHKNKPLAFVLLKVKGSGLENDEESLSFLQSLSNIIYVAFENKNLAKESIRQESIRKELEVASQMQSMLLPSELPHSEFFKVNAFYRSHAEVGGDYYDVFPLNEQEYGICMADVSGKGISAAFLMSNFQANVRAIFMYVQDLEELAKILNQKIIENAKGEKFITAFIAKYNILTKELTYVNCGHLPGVLMKNNQLHLLSTGTVGLGMLENLPFVKQETLIVDQGTLLVTFTDGLTELENDEGVFFGLEKIKEIVKDNKQLNPEELTAVVLRRLEAYKQHQDYKDDIAFMSCKLS